MSKKKEKTRATEAYFGHDRLRLARHLVCNYEMRLGVVLKIFRQHRFRMEHAHASFGPCSLRKMWRIK